MIPAPIVAAAQASHKKYFPLGPYPSVSIAQFGIESAWGKILSGENNPFGIKWNGTGTYTVRWTKEFYEGSYHVVEQKFQNYDSINDSFDAHAKLLATSPIYEEAQHATNVHDYVVAMAKHYATAPNYAQVILGVIASSNLTQYDTE